MGDELIVKCAFNGESEDTQYKKFYEDSIINVEYSRAINSNNEEPNFSAYACDGTISINDKSQYLKKRLLSADNSSNLNSGMLVELERNGQPLGKFNATDMKYQYSQNTFTFNLDDVVDRMEKIKVPKFLYSGFAIEEGRSSSYGSTYFLNGLQLFDKLVVFTKRYIDIEFVELNESLKKELSTYKFYTPYITVSNLKDMWSQFCIATMCNLYVNEENKLVLNSYLGRDDRPVIKLTRQQYGQDAVINLINKNNYSYVQMEYCSSKDNSTKEAYNYNLNFNLYDYNDNSKTYKKINDFQIYINTIKSYLSGNDLSQAKENAYNFKWAWKNKDNVEMVFKDFYVRSIKDSNNFSGRFAVEFTVPFDGVLLDLFNSMKANLNCDVLIIDPSGTLNDSIKTDHIEKTTSRLLKKDKYDNFVRDDAVTGEVVMTNTIADNSFAKKVKVVLIYTEIGNRSATAFAQTVTNNISINISASTTTNETKIFGSNTTKNAMGLEIPYSSLIRERNTKANPTYIANKLLEEYKYGRKTLVLTTSNFRMLNTNGAIIYNGNGNNIIKVGDIIQLEDLENLYFKITKITHTFNGGLDLNIEAVEITMIADEGNVAFKIDNVDYSNQIPVGTTWEEAITTYLSAKYTLSDNYIVNKDTNKFVVLNGLRVIKSETIQPADYITSVYYKTFSIGNNVYKFEPNDTWEYWITNTSDGFNTIGARILDNNIVVNDSYLTYNGERVIFTDSIVENAKITLESVYNQFIINDVRYNFVEGQTWKEWLNSNFNVDNFDVKIFNNSLEQGATEGVIHNIIDNDDKYLATSSEYIKGYLSTLNETIEEKTYYWVNYFKTVTINNVQYKFEPTMTWRTWVKSNYSSQLGNANSNFMVLETYKESYIKTSDGALFVLSGNTRMLADKVMEEGLYVTSTFYGTFKIANIQYKFILGMTWSEWIYSMPFEGISIGGYYVEGALIRSADGVSIVTNTKDNQNARVLSNDLIETNKEYFTVVPTTTQTYINFKIEGNTYTMPMGSTWGDFVDAYPNGYSETDDLFVETPDGKYVSTTTTANGKVKTKDSINDDGNYYLYDDKIRFTISGDNYAVPIGMTWGAWAETTNGAYQIVTDPADATKQIIKNIAGNSYVAYMSSTTSFLIDGTSNIESANYVLDPYFNFFKICDKQYKAVPGVNWANWVSSPYNTDGYRLVDGYVATSESISIKYLSTDGTLSTRVLSTAIPRDVCLVQKATVIKDNNSTVYTSFKPGYTWGQYVDDTKLNDLYFKKVVENDIIYIEDSSGKYYIINDAVVGDGRVKANDPMYDYVTYKYSTYYTTLTINNSDGTTTTLPKVVLGESWSSAVALNPTILELTSDGYVVLKGTAKYIFNNENRTSMYRVSSSSIISLNNTYYSGLMNVTKDINFYILVLDSNDVTQRIQYTAQKGMNFYEFYRSVDYDSTGFTVYGPAANVFYTYKGKRYTVEGVNGGTIITEGKSYTTSVL